MRCPKCGGVMNLHAEKPLNNDGTESVMVVYCCADCGNIEAVVEPL